MSRSRKPKPAHLGPQYAQQFCDESVARAYAHRPTHPPQTFEFLLTLMDDPKRRVLDLGCGTGLIARGLAPLVERVDAVDFSEAMIAQGRTLQGGDHANLRWICSTAEAFTSDHRYDLITCGDAIHWFDWDIVFPKFREMLEPAALLALLGVDAEPTWPLDLGALMARYSTNREFKPYNLLDELTSRKLFTIAGEKSFRSTPYQQPVDDFIESIHARNGFSRDRSSSDARDFDRGVREVVGRAYPDQTIEFQAVSSITWGEPRAKLHLRG